MNTLPSNHPDDFDDCGRLKTPVLFWSALAVLARDWWLSSLMVLTAHDSTAWPGIRLHLIALVAGVPGMARLFIHYYVTPGRTEHTGAASGWH
ncbi:TPA: DUF2919 family protein [Escherichia coli]